MNNSRSGLFRFKIAGLSITIDGLLPIVIAIICWVLAKRYFPSVVFLHNSDHYWILGGLGALGLILSILFHEMGHALAAKILHIPIERIHIYLFGGMAELRHRPLIPNQEFFVSMAGPIASGVASLIGFILLSQIDAKTQAIFYFFIHFVANMNLLMALFNLIPVFPLDGGRAVRALMWRKQKNFYKASITMHRFSSTLIGLFFLLSLYFFYVATYYAFWLGIFGLYIAYLLMKAKTELTTLPLFKELIYQLESDLSPAQIIHKIMDINPDALRKTAIPVLVDHKLHSILFGQQVIENLSASVQFESLIEAPAWGSYIDSSLAESYSNELEFKAEYIPVFENGNFMGLCDAYEMRFWLNETQNIRKS